MTRKLAMGTMKSPLMPVPAASGAFYLRAATPKLPWKAKMATLMVGTGAHPGNVGQIVYRTARNWFQRSPRRHFRHLIHYLVGGKERSDELRSNKG